MLEMSEVLKVFLFVAAVIIVLGTGLWWWNAQSAPAQPVAPANTDAVATPTDSGQTASSKTIIPK